MPDRRENLDRLKAELVQMHPAAPGPPDEPRRQQLCRHLAAELPLSHGTGVAPFAAICESGSLLSARELDARGIKPLDRAAPCVEVTLGTDDAVFLFAGPFRLAEVECGLLFRATLADGRAADSAASPFDSGGLIHHHCPPDGEDCQAFLARHELPVPDYREYLEIVLHRLFLDPWHYVDGVAPVREGPVRLVCRDADCRRWTFEVRVEREVPIQAHLQAVFCSRSTVGNYGSVQKMLHWCDAHRVDIVVYPTPRTAAAAGHEELKLQSIQYIRKLAVAVA